MSVPPEALQQLMGGGGGPPGMGGAPGGPMPGPAAAPMATPQSPEGQKLAALPKIEIAMKMLMSALPDLGVASKEGGMIYDVLKKLQSQFGEGKGGALVPAELAMLNQGPAPEMQAMMQAKPPGPPGMM